MRLILAAVIALPAAATAQTIWNVTAPDIQSVVNQASPGDVLVLSSQSLYSGFTLNKGLTIRGLLPNNSRAGIGGSPSQSSSSYSIVIAIPPGQVAHFERIDTSYSYAPWVNQGCRVEVTSGSVRFEDCLLYAESALKISNAQVVVTGGSVIGRGGPGSGFTIEATNSHLSLRNCSVTGNASSCSYPTCQTQLPARTAITAIASVLHAEGVTVQGGSQSSVPSPGAPAVDLQNSTAYFTDCSLTGGNGTVGGTALVNNGAPAELRNTTLIGGSPGGQSSSGPVVVNNALTRLDIAPAWQRGVTSTMTIQGAPSVPFYLFLTPATASTTIPLAVEPVWDAGAVGIVFGVLDLQGLAVLMLPVPNDPALQHATAWFQVASGASFPVRASTIAGGVVR